MKKKQKAHEKHQAQSGKKSKKRTTASTSSNWDQTVRAATGGENEAAASDTSSEMARGGFTPGEVGQIAPLDQEGEGNRQNDEAEELEQIEPDKFLKPH